MSSRSIRAKTAPLPTSDWLEEFKNRVTAHVHRGDYAGGLHIAAQAMKLHPESVDVRFQYAKLLGDWADELPPARQRKAKREAIAILRPLTRAVSGRDPEFRASLCLNYYYQKKDYRGMVRYGRRIAERGERKGHYAQGVGAAFQALAERERGRPAGARFWALRARQAWLRYGLGTEKYYFPHYCWALAQAILGDRAGAMKSLKAAARLSRRGLDDWEFKDVLEMLGGVEKRSPAS